MNMKAADVAEGIWTYLKKEKLTDMTEEVARLLLSRAGIEKRKAIVESAAKLSDSEQSEIEDILTEKWGKFEKIEFVINPELLGGMRVILGDKVLDLSVKHRLEKIYEQI